MIIAAASTVSDLMHSVVAPLVYSLSALAGIGCTLFLVIGGLTYMTSSGHPDKLVRAKKIIRNALLGLVVIIGAAFLTALLNHAYGSPGASMAGGAPNLGSIKPASTSPGLVSLLIKAITGVLESIVQSIASPFIKALSFFTSGTPLMAANSSVFKLWLALLSMADGLLVLTITLVGFKVMSSASLGMEELELKTWLPQLGLIFVLMNSSIFVIDSLIGLSNGLIDVIHQGFGNITVWQVLERITKASAGLGIAALLITIVFLVLAVILLVYYVGRLVTLYLGAALSPVVLLLYLLPSFKDFATSAVKIYISTVFVLFVHVIILELAASIFLGLAGGSQSPDPLMGLIVGLSTLVALIKTQGVLSQLSYVSLGPKTARRLGGQFVNSLSYTASQIKESLAS